MTDPAVFWQMVAVLLLIEKAVLYLVAATASVAFMVGVLALVELRGMRDSWEQHHQAMGQSASQHRSLRISSPVPLRFT